METNTIKAGDYIFKLLIVGSETLVTVYCNETFSEHICGHIKVADAGNYALLEEKEDEEVIYYKLVFENKSVVLVAQNNLLVSGNNNIVLEEFETGAKDNIKPFFGDDNITTETIKETEKFDALVSWKDQNGVYKSKTFSFTDKRHFDNWYKKWENEYGNKIIGYEYVKKEQDTKPLDEKNQHQIN